MALAREERPTTERRQAPLYAQAVEFGVLGPLLVREGGVDVEIRRGISRTLLIALLMRPGETVSADWLMETLWGDAQPRNPANALQIQVSYLRKALASGSADGRQPIVTRPGGYSLDVDPAAVDAVVFEQRVLSASEVDLDPGPDALQAQLQDLEEGLALWRGDALADATGEPFAEAVTIRLQAARLNAYELRFDLLLGLGRHREVVGEVGDLIAEHPLRERFHEQLMIALYRCGRQADALRAYEAARETLLDELGLDPGPGLQALERQVLAQDPVLAWQPRPRTGEGSARPVERKGRRSFVPAPLTRLIGRERDVARLLELMDKSRLLTLTGPGGAGKTRLAVELASTTAGSGQVWYVDLSAIDLPEQVGSTVASVLGATTGPDEDPIDVVAAALSTESGLLVLDTCEHVVAGAAKLATAVLRQAPHLQVLATSRRSLAVAGESAWPVPPLGLAPPESLSLATISASAAVCLFVERAQGVRPDFALTEENASDVAAICLALDGLPLAIELAAARTDVLSPAAIHARLQNRFDILVEGSSDAAERQQTLRATIEWSIGLLSPEEQTFFARLGVFAGGFDLDAAEAVAAEGGEDGLEILSTLVRHSMVVPHGTDRFRLLDTLRAYAEHLLADLDADATRRRHAEHYTRLAEACEDGVRGAGQVAALGRLRAETPNLHAAMEWSLGVGDLDVAMRLAGSLTWFWALDGRLDIATHHLERAVMVEDVAAPVRAKVLWGYALLVNARGDIDDALTAAELSVTLARSTGDDAAVGGGLNAVAVARWSRGDLDGAGQAHDEAIERFTAAKDVWGEAICRVLRARTALDQGAPEGPDLLDAGLAAAERSGDAHVLGLALGLVAEQLARRGELDAAIASGTESLRLQESIGYLEGTISALHLIARFHTEANDLDAAESNLVASLRLAWKMQHAAAICEALEGLAVVEGRRGSPAAADLLAAATAERSRRGIVLRPGDRPSVDDLRAQVDITGAHPAILAAVVSNLIT